MKSNVVEEEVGSIFFVTHNDGVLASEEGEAETELKEKISDVMNQGSLKFPLLGGLTNSQEIKVVGIFQELLRQV